MWTTTNNNLSVAGPEAQKVGDGINRAQVDASEGSGDVALMANDETMATPVVTSSSGSPARVDSPSPVVVTTDALTHLNIQNLDEEREHLTTFKSWGHPLARDKPGMVPLP